MLDGVGIKERRFVKIETWESEIVKLLMMWTISVGGYLFLSNFSSFP